MQSATSTIVNFAVVTQSALPEMSLRAIPSRTIMKVRIYIMKLLNYDKRTLILQNMRTTTKDIPDTYSKAQYRILCRLIRQKGITKPFFQLLLSSLYDVQDWKELNYLQMFELIRILTDYNYGKERI